MLCTLITGYVKNINKNYNIRVYVHFSPFNILVPAYFFLTFFTAYFLSFLYLLDILISKRYLRYIDIYIDTVIYIYIYIYVCVYIYICVCVCVCMDLSQ
jgi:hypothetical protein